MRLNTRDLIIAILVMFNIALMVLMYKVNKLVVERVPNRIEPDVYVMGLSEAIIRQNIAFGNLAYQVRWLRLHLEKCLAQIESERGLEPIPINFDNPNDPFVGMIFKSDISGPFVQPYTKAIPWSEGLESEEHNLNFLKSVTNLSVHSAQITSINGMDEIIENFYQRLKRIAPDPNTQ